MDYSIIIPAYNSEKTIGRCIDAINASHFDEPFEIIVVDDGSQDNTSMIAEKLGARLIQNASRQGPAFARNVGAKNARGNTFIFIDSDVLLFEDTLQKLTNFLKSETECSAVSCLFYPRCEMDDCLSRYKHLYTYYSYSQQPKLVNWTFTSTLAVKKSAFQAVGGFNENLQVNEDLFFGKELKRKGFKIGFNPQIFVCHLHRYSFLGFIKEEIKRSKTVMVIRFTELFHKTKNPEGNTLASHMIYSMALFPFLLIGFVLMKFNFPFFFVPLFLFYTINGGFLKLCKREFGLWFMIQVIFMIPFDCFLLCVGSGCGLWNFLKGQRI